MKIAPRTTDQAAQFLKDQHNGPLRWRALCQSLQRQARGLPAVYPSALSAALATPTSERVERVSDLRRGMVAFSDDPNDGNPYGHVYFIAGWTGPRNNPENLWTWTNDVLRSGGVDLVPITLYRAKWGDDFQFGATWLNGYHFDEFNSKPEPTRGSLGNNYEHAIEDVEKALAFHKKKGNDKIVRQLGWDIKRMKSRLNRFS